MVKNLIAWGREVDFVTLWGQLIRVLVARVTSPKAPWVRLIASTRTAARGRRS